MKTAGHPRIRISASSLKSISAAAGWLTTDIRRISADIVRLTDIQHLRLIWLANRGSAVHTYNI
jgi:hypothetical protein